MIIREITALANMDGFGLPSPISGVLFGGEDQAHKFIIRRDDGTAFAGTVTAKFLRYADDVTVPLTGSIEDGAATVTLIENCYMRPGRFKLTVYVTQGGSTTAIYCCMGTVDRTDGQHTIDPSGEINLDVTDLINRINTATASVPADYTALLATIAPTFSALTAYASGEYVWYNGTLYRFTADHAAGTWTGTDAAAAVLVEDISELKSATSELHRLGFRTEPVTLEWESGSINDINGSKTTNDKRIRARVWNGSCDALLIYAPSNMQFIAYGYTFTVNTASYVRPLLDKFVPINTNGYVIIPATAGLAYGIVARFADESAIGVSDAANVSIYKCWIPMNRTETEAASLALAATAKIHGRMYSWERGTIMASGGAANNEYVIRTVNYIPVSPGWVLSLGGVRLTAAFVSFYDSNFAHIGRYDLMSGDVTVPNETAYMKLVYGNTTASGIKVTNGYELVSQYELGVSRSAFDAYLDRIGLLRLRYAKGYWRDSGTINADSSGLCSAALLQLPVGSTVRVIIAEPDYVYSVKQGDATNELSFTDRLVTYSEFAVTGTYQGIMVYRRDGNGGYVDLSPEDFDGQILFFQNGYATNREVYVHDVPENIGVLNVINRCYQMAKLTYKPVANLPTQVNTEEFPGYVPAGTTVEGVMYSSVRDESLYVPQCVSLHSYMTALLNPNSYIYTRTEPSPHYNALTYYGAVCSSMVAWAYGIDTVIPTTVSFDTYDGMEIIENQSPYGLKLGDMLNLSDVHIELVTDIVRNNRGIIQYIEITDQINKAENPYTRRRQLKPRHVQSTLFDKGYVAYRYHYIYEVPYIASPWINLDDETAAPSYSTNLSPRRGESANWRPGETVEIDVLDASDYTSAALYKGETLISTQNVTTDDVLQYSGLAYGEYSVKLTDGTNESDPVLFDIIDTDVSYEPDGNGGVVVTYASNMGTAASISFCAADSSSTDYKAVRAFHVLTDAEIAAGTASLAAPSAGDWLMKVMFKTRFGLYSSDLVNVTIS